MKITEELLIERGFLRQYESFVHLTLLKEIDIEEKVYIWVELFPDFTSVLIENKNGSGIKLTNCKTIEQVDHLIGLFIPN